MRHVSIGFLPETFHPLHCFLSLSNRQERLAANSIVCSKRVRSSGTAYRAKTVSSDSVVLSEVMKMAAGLDGVGTTMPPWYQGRGLGEPPELRTHDGSRINLAKTAELEASGGAG
jgi:hypothetical protein